METVYCWGLKSHLKTKPLKLGFYVPFSPIPGAHSLNVCLPRKSHTKSLLAVSSNGRELSSVFSYKDISPIGLRLCL